MKSKQTLMNIFSSILFLVGFVMFIFKKLEFLFH
jgi:hypothetical protein